MKSYGYSGVTTMAEASFPIAKFIRLEFAAHMPPAYACGPSFAIRAKCGFVGQCGQQPRI